MEPNDKIIELVLDALANGKILHEHTWDKIKKSNDVICVICGQKAMRNTLRFKDREVE